MAPAPITEDYYNVLGVQQTATVEIITRCYKQLALKLHPDRNSKHDATEAFQLLGRAYETLKDESKRRAYDLIYPTINSRTRPSPQNSSPLSETAQIAAIQKSKQERKTRWGIKKNTFDSTIFELQREIRRLEQEIKNLDRITAAELAQEAQKNSWGAWLLSPIYKRPEDTEEEKADKQIKRQERRIEKDMKERRLSLKNSEMKKQEALLRNAKLEVDNADMVDDGKIRVLEYTKRAREAAKRHEQERIERERQARIWKQQQEQRERDAAEALKKRQAEQKAAEQKREEENKKRQKMFEDEEKRRQDVFRQKIFPEAKRRSGGYATAGSTTSCQHGGWWPKVQGRTACPRCFEVWTYLLQCPGCTMKACPRCQATVRPRLSHNTARANRKPPSSGYFYDYD